MEGSKTNFVDDTVLNTPKPTATSTVDRKSFLKKNPINPDRIQEELDDSLGILSLDGSNIANELQEKSKTNLNDTGYQLKQQRMLASNSLQRASKLAGLPSKYLKPDAVNQSSFSNLNLSCGSTISESDLLKSSGKSLKNTSTPRSSVAIDNSCGNNDLSRLSLGQSMAQLSYQIGNTDISIDRIEKEFRKVISSSVFSPAEEAGSMLMADELSWRKRHDMPITSNFSQGTTNDESLGKLSISAFFQQRSDNISALQAAISPVKTKEPVPLIERSASFSEEEKDTDIIPNHKSLSISAIQKFLAETDDTPRKVTNYLLKQGKKVIQDEEDQSFPLSKNSSYTSNYSENQVMRCIVSNKENVDTSNVQPTVKNTKAKSPTPVPTSLSENRATSTSSSSSSRTSSALTSLPNGKLPIESTRSELIWGCVKLDKCVTLDFLLRNKTAKRLCLQMSMSGYEFKIRKDNRHDSDPLSAAKFMLHPHESRLIIVSFIPTKIGAAVDELIFTSLDSNLQQTKKQCVRLFGYGGYGKIELHNLTQDTSGRFWLPLGNLDDHCVVTRRFVLKNTGSLPSFAYILFNPKELFAFANVTVTPNMTILIPNEEREVIVRYVPTADDYKVLQQTITNTTMVTDIGNLLIISGSEVNRGRLRRQCRKCTENNIPVDPVSNFLKEKVNGEIMPADIILFKESPGNLKEILKFFTRNEVILTLEQDPEQTIMPQYPDESGMYQSLYQDTVVCLESTTMHPSCKLEPASIILMPPTKVKDNLFLISEASRVLHFEVSSNPEGLEVTPKDGIIYPGNETVINVAYKICTIEKRLFKVLVHIENEVFEASVKVTFMPS